MAMTDLVAALTVFPATLGAVFVLCGWLGLSREEKKGAEGAPWVDASAQ